MTGKEYEILYCNNSELLEIFESNSIEMIL